MTISSLLLCLGPILAQQGVPVVSAPLGLAPTRRPIVLTLEAPAGADPLRAYWAHSGAPLSPAAAPGALQMQGVELLPLDVVGRTELTERLPGHARVLADMEGASRVILPGGMGTLFKYRRTESGSLRFGFLHVSKAGHPWVALERAAHLGVDPFLPRVGVGPLGTGFLAATQREAGGDLVEVDLVAQAAHVRTAGVPPLTFGHDGLWLADGWGFGVARSGIRRFARSVGALAEEVAVEGVPPALWRGDAALSADGGAAVAVGGSSLNALTPFAFAAVGNARRAAQTPARILPVGYAPDSSFGPFLAVSDDGETCAWAVESGTVRDVVVGKAASPAPAVTVSGDARLLDTLNEIGRVLFVSPTEVLFAAGEPNDPTEGGLESSDFFGVDVVTPGFPMRNVTGTSGDSTLPYFDGIPTWTPARMFMLPGRRLLVQDDEARQLVVLDLATGTWTSVLLAVRELDWIEVDRRTGAACFAVERDSQLREWEVHFLPPHGLSQRIDAGASITEFRNPVSSRGRWGAGVAYVRSDFGQEILRAVDLRAGTLVTWPGPPSLFRAPHAFLGDGRVVFSRQAGLGGFEQRVWDPIGGADLLIQAPLSGSHILR